MARRVVLFIAQDNKLARITHGRVKRGAAEEVRGQGNRARINRAMPTTTLKVENSTKLARIHLTDLHQPFGRGKDVLDLAIFTERLSLESILPFIENLIRESHMDPALKLNRLFLAVVEPAETLNSHPDGALEDCLQPDLSLKPIDVQDITNAFHISAEKGYKLLEANLTVLPDDLTTLSMAASQFISGKPFTTPKWRRDRAVV